MSEEWEMQGLDYGVFTGICIVYEHITTTCILIVRLAG